ncbi:hypothetical protein Tco_0237849 [Tanacetum coccineum]
MKWSRRSLYVLDRGRKLFKSPRTFSRTLPSTKPFSFADVLEIYVQQFWVTIKKVKRSLLYQFEIDNKTCQIDVEIFREILGIRPKVENQEFAIPSSFEYMIEFLLELGYKGELMQISHMVVDHMHQPWRTFGAIINKCLLGKTMSNDKLRPS